MKQKRFGKAGRLLCGLLAALFLFLSLTVGVSAEEPSAPESSGGVTSPAEGRAPFEIRLRFPSLFFPPKHKGERGEEGQTEPKKLIPGGGLFGVRLPCHGVNVVGEKEGGSPAFRSGMTVGDLIIAVNGKKVETTRDIIDAVTGSAGESLVLTVRGKDGKREITVKPEARGDGTWQLGILVRDSVAGIGTVTFVDPETGGFGGLGHAVGDGTRVCPDARGGDVTRVVLDGIEKGSVGEPGELRGMLTQGKVGEVIANTDCGVFGKLDPLPAGEAIPVAHPSEVTAGEATLRCTLNNGEPENYRVEIADLKADAGCTRCFSVKVTDPALLALTGGIVRGMSGSPILQNGRLVGAVTHVMVNDPTRGYGIFIDSMLRAMKSAEI